MYLKNKALLILNVPPPYGGGEIRAKLLSDYFSDKPGFIIVENSNSNKNKANQGKFSARNIYINIKYILKNIVFTVLNRPSVVYMSIPKSFFPLLKLIPVLLISKIIGVQVLGELAGRNFYFLEKKGLQSKLGLSILKSFNSIRVLGKSVGAKLKTYGLHKTVVIDNGVLIKDQKRSQKKIFNNKSLVLGFVGALHKKKGVLLLMQIAYLLKVEGYDFKLKLAGEWENEEDKRKVFNYIETNNLEKNIEFLGLIHGKEKWNFYKKIDVFVMPSYNEGQPLVLIEALAFGIPIVCSSVGAIPDTIANNYNGFMIDEFFPEIYVEKIKKLIHDKSLYAQISLCNLNTYRNRFKADDYLLNIHQWIGTHLNSVKNAS